LTSTTCSEPVSDGIPRANFRDVIRSIKLPKRRSESGGFWPYEPNDLIRQLTDGSLSLDNPKIQSELLDWIESADYNKFLNKKTGEKIYALAAKRGNVVYAARKSKKRDEVKNALVGKEFDIPAPGFRDRRLTRILLVTVNFDPSRFTKEHAWAALRSKPTEGADYIYNVLNRLNANISKIFGTHGTLICKEAQASGFPAPHLIIVLDRPVPVMRHVSRSGAVSWRICDNRILDRIGKGPLMRKLAKTDYTRAIDLNPIWKNGFIDFEGVVKGDKVKNNRDAFSYAFKYLTKCLTEDGTGAIAGLTTISEVGDKSLRTALYTHLGNKCFRTRDISFGKGFKDRIGLLPSAKDVGESEWARIRTYTELEYLLNSRMDELRQWEAGAQKLKALMAQEALCRGIHLSIA
jgi:hypothetical protein